MNHLANVFSGTGKMLHQAPLQPRGGLAEQRQRFSCHSKRKCRTTHLTTRRRPTLHSAVSMIRTWTWEIQLRWIL